MALINIPRFRDVLVRTKIAETAPALELTVALDQEIQDAQQSLVTSQEFRAAMAELRQYMAEQHQRTMIFTVSAIALGVAILGIIIAVT